MTRRFFAISAKSFRELRWWYCTLASNRRIWLLHSFSFYALFICAMPNTPLWDFNGWHRMRAVPFLLLFAPILGFLSNGFDMWACGGTRAIKTFQTSAYLTALMVFAAVVCTALQMIVHYDDFQTSKWSGHIVASAVIILLVGPVWLIVALLPSAAPSTAFDANSFFESRTAALVTQSWFARHSWWPRREAVDVLRLYSFWIGVWGTKAAPIACDIFLSLSTI